VKETVLDSRGSLRAEAISTSPSVVPGLTEWEFEELARDILWWSSRPLGERVRAMTRHARHERLLLRLAEQNRAR
jgi:hypothetical protein